VGEIEVFQGLVENVIERVILLSLKITHKFITLPVSFVIKQGKLDVGFVKEIKY